MVPGVSHGAQRSTCPSGPPAGQALFRTAAGGTWDPVGPFPRTHFHFTGLCLKRERAVESSCLLCRLLKNTFLLSCLGEGVGLVGAQPGRKKGGGSEWQSSGARSTADRTSRLLPEEDSASLPAPSLSCPLPPPAHLPVHTCPSVHPPSTTRHPPVHPALLPCCIREYSPGNLVCHRIAQTILNVFVIPESLVSPAVAPRPQPWRPPFRAPSLQIPGFSYRWNHTACGPS